MMSESHLTIHVDGASRGNPGPASIGIVIRDADGTLLLERGECIGQQTNNVAEYTAFLKALQEAALFKPSRIDIHTDSQLVARQISGQYKVKKQHLRVLKDQVVALMSQFATVNVRHVPREENSHADEMANRALDAGQTVQ